MNGTHTIEQMVVAAQEVSASTAQLVAASRVKGLFLSSFSHSSFSDKNSIAPNTADKGSKTQENLERASKAVTEATKVPSSSFFLSSFPLSSLSSSSLSSLAAFGQGSKRKFTEESPGREPV